VERGVDNQGSGCRCGTRCLLIRPGVSQDYRISAGVVSLSVWMLELTEKVQVWVAPLFVIETV
jgi:hypothetical protein